MTPGRDGRINGEILSARFIHLEVSRYSPNEELDISWSTLDEFVESTLQPAFTA
jgi:hypothetical protein